MNTSEESVWCRLKISPSGCSSKADALHHGFRSNSLSFHGPRRWKSQPVSHEPMNAASNESFWTSGWGELCPSDSQGPHALQRGWPDVDLKILSGKCDSKKASGRDHARSRGLETWFGMFVYIILKWQCLPVPNSISKTFRTSPKGGQERWEC